MWLTSLSQLQNYAYGRKGEEKKGGEVRSKKDNAEEQLKIERIGNRGIKKGEGGAKGDKQKEESMKK